MAVAKLKRGPVAKALWKPTGATTVSVEYIRADGSDQSELELDVNSMQLRKLKTAAIWTSDLDALAGFAKEQRKAKGNFPGPCPVIWSGDSAEAEAAAASGASAVVLRASDLTHADTIGKLGLEVIWSVASEQEVESVVAAGLGSAFLVEGPELVAALPKDAVKVAAVPSMLEDNAEITMGRDLAAAGCKALLLREACVGDAEDVPYTGFAIEGLTSKASSEFKITGMTGHVNGHFGTGTFEKTSNAIQWARKGGNGAGPTVASKAAVVGKSAMRSWAAK